MPKKKRHQTLFSKPQSTPPASLETTRSTATQDSNDKTRSVNQILADLRRANPSASSAGPAATLQPSVPPELRPILDIPEPPPPAPRPGRPRVDANGRRLPPGPAAPRSWLSQSRHAPASLRPQDRADLPRMGGLELALHSRHGSLPGAYLPDTGSLMDLSLRSMALDWDIHREYNQYHFAHLPGRVRAALVQYLGIYRPKGVMLNDLRALFKPPSIPHIEGQGHSEDEGIDLDLANISLTDLNEEVTSLNLTGSIEKSLRLNLTELLFPAASRTTQSTALHASWDADSDSDTPSSIPRPLLPNLTQLSLALLPSPAPGISAPWTPFSPHAVSWKHLLALASHLPKLTHLSLAHWPPPALTPNARLTRVVNPTTGRSLDYAGTGPYSHALDQDWSEALSVLRRLSSRLYGLEWLDLTGCAWAKALRMKSETDEIDWVGAWGKVDTLLLKSGIDEEELKARAWDGQRVGAENFVLQADVIEKHIVKKREGRGKLITVVRDALPPRPVAPKPVVSGVRPVPVGIGLGMPILQQSPNQV